MVCGEIEMALFALPQYMDYYGQHSRRLLRYILSACYQIMSAYNSSNLLLLRWYGAGSI
jgi:hypothetical protein